MPCAIVDCNSFYASCERVFDPRLAERPVIVLSNNDGCVIARTREAKALGIAMAVPFFQIQALARRHGVAVFSANFALYGDLSARVMEVLSRFSPSVEVYSIDEAFLDLDGLPGDPAERAREIRRTVDRWTGVPVSVGIGPTKTLAKVANHLAKEDPSAGGVWDLSDPGNAERDLRTVPVEEVWGIGPASARKLETAGIRTAKALREAPDDWLLPALGLTGLRTAWELRGKACLRLATEAPPKKAITVSRSFREALRDPEELRRAVAAFASRAAEKLREGRQVAGALVVHAGGSRFERRGEARGTLSAAAALDGPTCSTPAILRAAGAALSRILRGALPAKRAGVMLHDLALARDAQGSLFAEGSPARASRLMETVDRINARLGREAVHFASLGMRPPRSAQARLSPGYTTRWDQIPVARALP